MTGGEVNWKELSTVGRMSAAFWLILFVILIVFLLLNMIIAIIMEHYGIIKAKMGDSETLWMTTRHMMRRAKLKFAGKFVPNSVVLEALEQDRDNWYTDTGHVRLLDKNSLVEVCHKSKMYFSNLSKKQSLEVIACAITDYHMRKNGREDLGKNGKMDAVLRLIQKTHHHIKGCTSLVGKSHGLRDQKYVAELQWFSVDIQGYFEQVRQEGAWNAKELERLNVVRAKLREKLKNAALLTASGPEPEPEPADPESVINSAAKAAAAGARAAAHAAAGTGGTTTDRFCAANIIDDSMPEAPPMNRAQLEPNPGAKFTGNIKPILENDDDQPPEPPLSKDHTVFAP